MVLFLAKAMSNEGYKQFVLQEKTTISTLVI